MADTKISALTAATTPLAGTEVLPIVQSGTTKKVAVADLTAGRAVSALSLTLTGSPLGVGSGGTGTSTTFTAGSVVFAGASGVYSQNNSKLFWDNTNNRFGIGTASPTHQLHVSGGLTKLDYNTSLMYLQQTTDTAQQAGHRFQTIDGGVYVATFAGLNTSNDQRLIIEGRGGEMAVFGQYGRSGFTSPISGYVGTILADGTTFNKAMSWYPSGGVSIGNTTDPGASNLSVTGKSIAANFQTISNTATIAGSATATVLTLSSSVTGTYYVTADFGSQGNEIYSGMAIIVANAGSFRIVTNGGGSRSAISLSGANVQITNALGITLTAYAAAMFVGY